MACGVIQVVLKKVAIVIRRTSKGNKLELLAISFLVDKIRLNGINYCVSSARTSSTARRGDLIKLRLPLTIDLFHNLVPRSHSVISDRVRSGYEITSFIMAIEFNILLFQSLKAILASLS